MALILALIIIVVLGCRSLFVKMDKAQYQREYEEFTDNLEKSNEGFDRYIATKEETDAVRNSAFYESVQYRNGSQVNEETIQAREMRERIWKEVHIQPTPEMVTCAILAQKGLVPYEMSWSAYATSPAEPRREFWGVENKFLKWLDIELLNHGMGFRMRYVSYDNRSALGHGNDLMISESIQQENTKMMGTYYWTSKQGRYGKRYLIVKPYDYRAPFIG